MQIISQGYQSLSLVVALNYDRVLIPLAILVGLAGGAMIGHELWALHPADLPAVH